MNLLLETETSVWGLVIGFSALALVAGGGAVGFFCWNYLRGSERTRGQVLDKTRQEAEKLAREMKEDARKELDSFRKRSESDLQRKRTDVNDLEKRVIKKDDSLNRKLDLLNQNERRLESLERAMEKRGEAADVREQEVERLIETCGTDGGWGGFASPTPSVVTCRPRMSSRGTAPHVMTTSLLCPSRN